jgi:outer membrane biosynthesis protein TonB
LAPAAPARAGRIVGRVVPVPAVDAELGGAETNADLSAADVASDAQAVMTEAVREPPALIEAKLPSLSGGIEPEDADNNPVPVGFAELAVVYRSLEATAAPRDRTFWIALGLVLALHAGALIGTLRFDASQTARREREGQVDEPTTITVELVENADAKSKEKMAQIGERVAPQPPVERPPEPQPPPQREQPEQKPEPLVKPEKPAEKAPEKLLEKPPEPKAETPPEKAVEQLNERVKPDDGPDPLKAPLEPRKDVAVEPLPQEPRPQLEPKQAAPPSPPPVPIPAEFKGAAPAGKERAYAKSVREILAKTKPQIWVGRAEVWVGFVLKPNGDLKVLKIIKSSKDLVFDDVIAEWIKRAKFARPPADAKPDDLEHVIHFVVE